MPGPEPTSEPAPHLAAGPSAQEEAPTSQAPHQRAGPPGTFAPEHGEHAEHPAAFAPPSSPVSAQHLAQSLTTVGSALFILQQGGPLQDLPTLAAATVGGVDRPDPALEQFPSVSGFDLSDEPITFGPPADVVARVPRSRWLPRRSR